MKQESNGPIKMM